MNIWLSNASSTLTFERAFFGRLCHNLKHRLGTAPAIERFPGLNTLAALPGLDQPRRLQRTPLVREIYDAWDLLWTLPLHEVILESEAEEAATRSNRPAEIAEVVREGLFGRYLARPLHQLAGFVAAAPSNGGVRAATHRELIAGPSPIQSWRLIHGGQSRLSDSASSKPT